MIIKNWIFGQVVELPDQEFNRIEENIEEIVDKNSWASWPAMTFKKDRDYTWIATASELNNIENNLTVLSDKMHIDFVSRLWAYDDPITYEILNIWENFIELANAFEPVYNYEYVGTFATGEAGLI